MNHLRVGFDIDDVLLPSSEHTIRWYNHHFGTQLTPRHWYRNIPVEPWAAESEEQIIERVNEIMNSTDYLSSIAAMEGATRVLDELVENGDEFFAITSRPHAMATMTHKALELCYPGMFPEGDVHFINHSTASNAVNKIRKVEIALSRRATHFVDDFETHLLPMAEAGITPLLFGKDYAWNSGASLELERVESWQHLGERLQYERTK